MHVEYKIMPSTRFLYQATIANVYIVCRQTGRQRLCIVNIMARDG